MSTPKPGHYHLAIAAKPGVTYYYVYLAVQCLLWAINAHIFGSIWIGLLITLIPPFIATLAGYIQKRREQSAIHLPNKVNSPVDSIENPQERTEFVKLVQHL